MSLDLLHSRGADATASLLDVGGGSAALVDALVADGWQDLAVLDISPVALQAARARLPRSPVDWIVADLLHWWPQRRYDWWHDRAVFHFLAAEQERQLYRERLAAAVRPGGYAILATFAPDGPEACSGLPVCRYDPADLAVQAAPGFSLIESRRQVHVTPSGGEQAFTWVVLRAPERRQ